MAEKKTNLSLDALPVQIRDRVNDFAERLVAGLRDDLRSITVVGSSLTDDFKPGHSDINVARTRYNEAAMQLNSYAKALFGSFFCKRAKVEPVAYFEATEQAKSQVPKVEF